MIHAESGQLFIGPYAIDSAGRVRVIPYSVMPGRHTANARHLYDPAHYIYYGTMEEGLYEVNVHTLAVKELFRDGNFQKKTTPGYAPEGALLPAFTAKACIPDRESWCSATMAKAHRKPSNGLTYGPACWLNGTASNGVSSAATSLRKLRGPAE